MSNKMELSLDEILKTSKNTAPRRGRGGRKSTSGRPAPAATPVGGVAKNTRQSKQAKSVPTAPAASFGGETKIMVSNLVCRTSTVIFARPRLTVCSHWMLSKANFRYVRPMQVFEPTVPSLLRTNTSSIEQTSYSLRLYVWMLSHVLHYSHAMVCAGHT